MELNIRRTVIVARAFAALFAAAVLLSLPAHARAQLISTRGDERRADMEQRQRALRSLSRLLNKAPRTEKVRRPSYKEVAEDFEQLQVRNYNLAGVLEPGAQFDYGKIEEEAGQVRHRAGRLKSALALPYAKDDVEGNKDGDALTPERMKSAIASLDKLVNSFAWNPVFHNPDVLDAENSSKAGRELEDILRLSERIKESARAVGKGK
jgi:hypothetical protein